MKYYKYKMNFLIMNIVAIIFTLFLIFIYFYFFTLNFLLTRHFIYVFLWLFLHEIIHGIAFISFKEVNKSKVVFGAKLEKGIFYCMCKQVVSKRVILTSLVAPFFTIGIITFIIAIIFNWPILGFLSIFNISGATGDLLMAIMFLRLPKDIKYTDLDDCESFVVLSNENLKDNKYFGFNLIEHGLYTNKIKPYDFRKISCSKPSIFFLVFLFILYFFNLCLNI